MATKVKWLAVGVVLGAALVWLVGGPYQVIRVSDIATIRINTWTGTTWYGMDGSIWQRSREFGR